LLKAEKEEGFRRRGVDAAKPHDCGEDEERREGEKCREEGAVREALQGVDGNQAAGQLEYAEVAGMASAHAASDEADEFFQAGAPVGSVDALGAALGTMFGGGHCGFEGFGTDLAGVR
jgi:hypothetical protein